MVLYFFKEEVRREESLCEAYYNRSIILAEQSRQDMEGKEQQISKLLDDMAKLQLKVTENYFRDQLIDSLKYIISLQNATIIELSNRIDDHKFANRLEKIGLSFRNKLSHVSQDNNESPNNDETTELISHKIATKTVDDELRDAKNELFKCNQRISNFLGNATSCVPFGYSTGIHEIHFPGVNPTSVLCDAQTAGPGWTVIQQRLNGDEDFYKNWTDYKNGFGNLNGEFFIGLESLYRMTNYQTYELYILLERFNNITSYARYDNFQIGTETEKYVLKSVGKFTGTALDGLTPFVNRKFTTFDQDNDDLDDDNLAIKNHGGWWYSKDSTCLVYVSNTIFLVNSV